MTENIRFAWFEDQLIALNILDDTYTVLSAEQSRRLHLSAKDRAETIAPDALCRPTPDDCAVQSIVNRVERHYTGVSQNCWHLTSHDVSFSHGAVLVAHALMTLHTVHRCCAAERLAGLKHLIEQKRERRRLTSGRDIDDLVRSLNAACMLYPRKTKCLEWAGALLLLGFRYGFDLRLVMGVQNRPFYAHAWVEHEGRIIGDEPSLRNQLAVILEVN
ncbi:lasso peptide biosynthesis B2 protein [Cupriavidus sp. CP313]